MQNWVAYAGCMVKRLLQPIRLLNFLAFIFVLERRQKVKWRAQMSERKCGLRNRRFAALKLTLNMITILLTVFILNIFFRSPMTHRMPRWVQRVFLQVGGGRCRRLLKAGGPAVCSFCLASSASSGQNPTCRAFRRKRTRAEIGCCQESPIKQRPATMRPPQMPPPPPPTRIIRTARLRRHDLGLSEPAHASNLTIETDFTDVLQQKFARSARRSSSKRLAERRCRRWFGRLFAAHSRSEARHRCNRVYKRPADARRGI